MKYVIDNIEFKVIIEKKKNKNTYIRVKEDMNIYVSTNYLATKYYIKKLLDENVDSIKKMINTRIKKNEKDELFFYLGNSYDIIFVPTISSVDIDFENQNIYVKDSKTLDRWYIKEVNRLFAQRFEQNFNHFEECSNIPKLKIRKMKTRWGVYNRVNHSVTLNSELIKYDTSCLDYVIYHELSHIIHFDHSKDFWSLVSKYFPNYKKVRKELKE